MDKSGKDWSLSEEDERAENQQDISAQIQNYGYNLQTRPGGKLY